MSECDRWQRVRGGEGGDLDGVQYLGGERLLLVRFHGGRSAEKVELGARWQEACQVAKPPGGGRGGGGWVT